MNRTIYSLIATIVCIAVGAGATINATYIAEAKQDIAPIQVVQPLDDTAYRTTFVQPYVSGVRDEVDLSTLQCPIPMEDRVQNWTRIQCVFASIEMIGRWAEEPKLTNPPITSRSDCKGYSGPSDAAQKLTRLGVKFEQAYGDRAASLELLKKAMREGRGCLIGIPGHAMVCIHYSEEEDRVCWVDNSDRSLRVQTTTVAGFNKFWRGWVLVIYADNDIIPYKLSPLNKLPITDEANPQRQFPKEFLPRI